MSSAGGGSGIGGGGSQFQVVDGARVQLPGGAQVDLSTTAGVAAAESALSPDQLAELEGLMRGMGFTRAGGAFVPSDAYEMRRELGVTGPSSTTAGITKLDQEIAEHVFVKAGLASPYNANTTDKLFGEIRGAPQFKAAVGAMNAYNADPTSANAADLSSRMAAVQAQFPNGNIMEVLFLVFRESIKDTNEDKKYFLVKLQEFNKMAEQLSDYLSYLVDRSQAMSQTAEGQKYPEKVHIDVRVDKFDLSTLGPNGDLVKTDSYHKRMDRMSLSDTIKLVESAQETIRNKRQMASTAFQNFDQKSNQLYNLMSSVLKSMNEMRGGVVRNML